MVWKKDLNTKLQLFMLENLQLLYSELKNDLNSPPIFILNYTAIVKNVLSNDLHNFSTLFQLICNTFEMRYNPY